METTKTSEKGTEEKTNSRIKWKIDPTHSEISFKVKHMMITSVRGHFKKFDAIVHTDGIDFSTADVNLWIDPLSIDTHNDQRDEHLRGRDFFDVKNHKQITFVSNTIEQGANHRVYELTGDLTIRGITKEVKLEVEFGGIMKDPFGKEKAGFSVTGKVNRLDWGLTWNQALDAGGAVLGEEVIIQCNVELMNVSDE